ncbi:CAF17-like 4Fe-4S cluster assembly/insertion protein YgfZ [Natronobiforma cellulositropha]|uniref:CAF17-like 4Fe-4S cluster assembly/insertion protein YgfZ n=1 Tax=Natronobiforma cellulositropha TaxID=1679076 RepID=UPI0021D5CF28|nr:glycine cleavage T C-terminal barrel domain-containing protein [Natronobiforma cellulositropha]
MTRIESIHADRGATFTARGGRRVVDHYGRPERAHRAVRNGVGVVEHVPGILVVEGADRREYVDNVVSNRVPATDGEGCYALLLEPQGRIELACYVYDAGERLLVFTPPGLETDLAADWREKVFIQDVDIGVATDEFAVFGVCGPRATEAVASVFAGPSVPDRPLSFVRGSVDGAGVTVVRSDGLTGEEGYDLICAAADAAAVYETLTSRGELPAPFGYRTWESLTLEAGTPLFASELEGRIPNVLGVRNALDFEKGCFVGQEVVSRVENRGQPSQRLVGLTLESDPDDALPDPDDALPDPGAAVVDVETSVGEVTRALVSPSLERPLALALVDFGLEETALTVRTASEETPATLTDLPFVEGSARSARLPTY